MTPGTTVPVDWVREWARGLDGQAVLLSNHIVVDLPTRAAAAAAATVSEQVGITHERACPHAHVVYMCGAPDAWACPCTSGRTMHQWAYPVAEVRTHMRSCRLGHGFGSWRRASSSWAKTRPTVSRRVRHMASAPPTLPQTRCTHGIRSRTLCPSCLATYPWIRPSLLIARSR